MIKGGGLKDFTRIPTAELAVIVSTGLLNIKTREKALDEFARRLKQEKDNYMDFMNGLILITVCSHFSARSHSLMEFLDEKLRDTRELRQRARG